MRDDYLVILNDGTQRHEFLLNGGPISQTGNVTLFAVMGRLASAWSRLEQHVDSILLQVNKKQHSNEVLSLFDPNHPRPFTDKIRLLKKYFNKHPALRGYKEQIRVFTKRAKELGEDRNIYLHSVIQSYNERTEIVEFLSIRPIYDPTDPYKFRIKRYKPPLSHIRNFVTVVNSANNYLEEISRRLFTDDAVARLRKPE